VWLTLKWVAKHTGDKCMLEGGSRLKNGVKGCLNGWTSRWLPQKRKELSPSIHITAQNWRTICKPLLCENKPANSYRCLLTYLRFHMNEKDSESQPDMSFCASICVKIKTGWIWELQLFNVLGTELVRKITLDYATHDTENHLKLQKVVQHTWWCQTFAG